MNKNYNFAESQRQHYLFWQRKRQSKKLAPPHTHSRNITFSYKGVVIDKGEGLYKMRAVKLEGFNGAYVQGEFNVASALRSALDNALSRVDSDKHLVLRAKNQNVQCEHCGAVFLLRAAMLIPYMEGHVLDCPYCSHEHWEDTIKRLGDEVFY
ncbi:hypothetical protein AWY96_01865 [Serratia plymuthica]|uniref:hypothetical protein n=1 Tax=Serratia plymuthica TaxID=82996 RepID=UPI0007A0711F|nr:hypothetical protein [Serratia plymuthica]KYQ97313.1 hypothetical protein AWY96_01865 [Serratia plymuthica]